MSVSRKRHPTAGTNTGILQTTLIEDVAWSHRVSVLPTDKLSLAEAGTVGFEW